MTLEEAQKSAVVPDPDSGAAVMEAVFEYAGEMHLANQKEELLQMMNEDEMSLAFMKKIALEIDIENSLSFVASPALVAEQVVAQTCCVSWFLAEAPHFEP